MIRLGHFDGDPVYLAAGQIASVESAELNRSGVQAWVTLRDGRVVKVLETPSEVVAAMRAAEVRSLEARIVPPPKRPRILNSRVQPRP